MSGQIQSFRTLEDASRVLLIDDDPLILRALATRIGHAGHEVRAFTDGSSGLWSLNSWPADVAVIDINMAGLNGFQVAREIQERYPSCKVILQTASRSEDVWHQLANQPVDAVLEKPFDSRELLDLIDAA